MTSVRDRLMAKVEVNKVTGCWIWCGGIDSRGYGSVQIEVAGVLEVRAHRAAYRAFVGSIPDGFQIDHLCRVTSCVNPDHLEAVTPRENTRRAFSHRGKVYTRPLTPNQEFCRQKREEYYRRRREGDAA